MESLKKFCCCEQDTMIDLTLLGVLDYQDFHSSYPAVEGGEGESIDEISIKLLSNQQKASWRYNRILEECKIIGGKQKKCI